MLFTVNRPTRYIPITQARLEGFIEDPTSIEDFSIVEIAGLLAIQVLHDIPQKDWEDRVERQISQGIEIGRGVVEESGRPTLTQAVALKLSPYKIKKVFPCLEGTHVQLMNEKMFNSRAYLLPDGLWDSQFNQREFEKWVGPRRAAIGSGRSLILTDEQNRVLSIIRGNSDEPLHIQGYPGVGKTEMLRALIQLLGGLSGSIIMLATRWQQLELLRKRLDPGQQERVRFMTVGQFAGSLIPQDLTRRDALHMRRQSSSNARISSESIVRHLGLVDLEGQDANRQVSAIINTVKNYCWSADEELSVSHLPWWLATLDASTQAAIIAKAQEYWNCVLHPIRDFRPPVRAYHQVKFVASSGWRAPDWASHIIIDEAHDLQPALVQILDRCPQGSFTLGDEYQNLQNRAPARRQTVRKRYLVHGVRSGKEMENILNPVIMLTPGRTKERFIGNNKHKTKIKPYDKAAVPEEPATILVKDYWALFEWIQRLSAGSATFAVAGEMRSLNRFVEDCIELFEHGTRSAHPEIAKYHSWKQIKDDHHDHPGFLRVERMLKRGYRQPEWQATKAKMTTYEATYLVGRVEDLRNAEFDTVMLTPDTARDLWAIGDKNKNVHANELYVAASRAKYKLIVPCSLLEWVEEIGARYNREPHLDLQ